MDGIVMKRMHKVSESEMLGIAPLIDVDLIQLTHLTVKNKINSFPKNAEYKATAKLDYPVNGYNYINMFLLIDKNIVEPNHYDWINAIAKAKYTLTVNDNKYS